MRIEPVADADVEQLSKLAHEIWRLHYPGIISAAQIEYMLAQRYAPSVLRAELQREGVWWDKLVLDELPPGGTIAGFASYFLTRRPGEMKLDKLYVRLAERRRGYGRRLLEQVSRTALRRECRTLVLAVNKRNAGAIDMYRTCGFNVTGAAVKDIGGGYVMDDYLMSRVLVA